jgi:dolichol-phosphate mannosyltransferase
MADRQDAGAPGEVVVVIPTYDERENLGPIVERVHAATPTAHVLVVDDNSPDGTGELAERLAADDERVHVLHRTDKTGLGAAYVDGFEWALGRGFDVVVEMDADGSHAPEDLPRLLEVLASGRADVVLGSRYVPGGKVVNWPWYRQWLSRGGNVYSKLALGVAINDVTGGYRAYRRQVLETLALGEIASQGYCFQVDLARRSVEAGFAVVEVPITFVEREYGESKMSGVIVREALLRVTKWGLHRRGEQLAGLVRSPGRRTN